MADKFQSLPTPEEIAGRLVDALVNASTICTVCGAKHEIILGVPESYKYCRKCARERREGIVS